MPTTPLHSISIIRRVLSHSLPCEKTNPRKSPVVETPKSALKSSLNRMTDSLPPNGATIPESTTAGTQNASTPSSEPSSGTGQAQTAEALSKPIGKEPGKTGVTVRVPDLPAVLGGLTAQLVSETLSRLKSSLPDGLQSALRQNDVTVPTEKLAAQEAAQLAGIATWADRALQAGPRPEITASIARLFSHYTPRLNPAGLSEGRAREVAAERMSLKADWLEDMEEYPAWVVADACRQWRRCAKGMFQPSIADIRGICAETMAPVMRTRYQAARLVREAADKAERDAYAEAERQKLWGKESLDA